MRSPTARSASSVSFGVYQRGKRCPLVTVPARCQGTGSPGISKQTHHGGGPPSRRSCRRSAARRCARADPLGFSPPRVESSAGRTRATSPVCSGWCPVVNDVPRGARDGTCGRTRSPAEAPRSPRGASARAPRRRRSTAGASTFRAAGTRWRSCGSSRAYAALRRALHASDGFGACSRRDTRGTTAAHDARRVVGSASTSG